MATSAQNPQVAQTIQAMRTFCFTQDNAQRKAAEEYLKAFEKSVVAWSVCTSILAQPQLAKEVYFMAARALRAKLEFSFSELPANSHAAFRDTILKHLVRFSDPSTGMSKVHRQLSYCVGFLVVLMPDWPNALQGLVQNMLKEEHLRQPLLDILTVVPEYACGRDRVRISDERRQAATTIVDAFSTHIFPFMQHVLNASSETAQRNAAAASSRTEMQNNAATKLVHDLQRSVFDCLGTWVRYSQFDAKVLASSPLLDACYNALGSPPLFFQAADTIHTMIVKAEDMQRYQPLVERLLAKTLALAGMYNTLLQQRKDEECQKIAMLFVELGESFQLLVLNGSPQAQNILEAMLQCTGHPNTTISSLTFTFWYNIAVELGRIKEAHQRDVKLQFFNPYFTRLVDVLRRIMRYPDNFDQLDREEQEDLKRFRNQAADSMMDAATVVGTQQAIAQIFDALMKALPEYRADTNKWHNTEACLYCVRSLARKVESSDSDSQRKLICRVMELIPQFEKPAYIQYTALLIVGRYADWLNNNTQYLRGLLKFVVTSLNGEAMVVSAGSLAFSHVCDGCSKHLAKDMLPELLHVYKQSHALRIEDQKEVIEGLCMVCLALPPDRFAQGLGQLILPVVADVRKVITTASQHHSNLSSGQVVASSDAAKATAKGIHDGICSCLDRLAHIFQKIHVSRDPGPREKMVAVTLVELLQQLWPLLENVLKLWRVDDHVMEKLSRVWKYAIKTCGLHFHPFLQRLLTDLASLFTQTPHSSFLYVASHIVDTFGGHAEYNNILLQIFTVFSQQSFLVLKTSESFKEQPDIVEDYFDLVSRFLRKCPALVIASNMMQNVIQCGLRGITCEHREANSALMAFYGELFRQGCPALPSALPSGTQVVKTTPPPPPQVVQALQQHLQTCGQTLVDGLIHVVCADMPHYITRSISSVLEEMFRFAKGPLQHCMVEALKKVPDTKIPNAAKHAFVVEYFKAEKAHDRRRALYNLEAEGRKKHK